MHACCGHQSTVVAIKAWQAAVHKWFGVAAAPGRRERLKGAMHACFGHAVHSCCDQVMAGSCSHMCRCCSRTWRQGTWAWTGPRKRQKMISLSPCRVPSPGPACTSARQHMATSQAQNMRQFMHFSLMELPEQDACLLHRSAAMQWCSSGFRCGYQYQNQAPLLPLLLETDRSDHGRSMGAIYCCCSC